MIKRICFIVVFILHIPLVIVAVFLMIAASPIYLLLYIFTGRDIVFGEQDGVIEWFGDYIVDLPYKICGMDG